MPRLDAEDSVCEVWHGHGDGPLTQGQSGTIHYRHDDDVVFGAIILHESEFEASAGKLPLQRAAEAAYRQIFALLNTLPFPYVFRYWNYFAQINAHSFGLERYRQFNLGRQDAFTALRRDYAAITSPSPIHVPAACALGTAQGPLTIAFLAGRSAPLNIENPRQVSAYHYPAQYGARSPLFARASLARVRQEDVLVISGTARVVGHETLHAGDVVAQTRETLINIEAVLAEANRMRAANQPPFEMADLNYKVYVRRPLDLPQIRNELMRCAGTAPKAVYLQADVCREDLLLEIEACAAQPVAPVADGKY